VVEQSVIVLFNDCFTWELLPPSVRARVEGFLHGVEIWRPTTPYGWVTFTRATTMYFPKASQVIRLCEAQVIDLSEDDDQPNIIGGGTERQAGANKAGPSNLPRLF